MKTNEIFTEKLGMTQKSYISNNVIPTSTQTTELMNELTNTVVVQSNLNSQNTKDSATPQNDSQNLAQTLPNFYS